MMLIRYISPLFHGRISLEEKKIPDKIETHIKGTLCSFQNHLNLSSRFNYSSKIITNKPTWFQNEILHRHRPCCLSRRCVFCSRTAKICCCRRIHWVRRWVRFTGRGRHCRRYCTRVTYSTNFKFWKLKFINDVDLFVARQKRQFGYGGYGGYGGGFGRGFGGGNINKIVEHLRVSDLV